ncbi:MAG: ribosomal protein S18-alanine N-acetyltransferase [Peptostreptococcaceae bacterium]
MENLKIEIMNQNHLDGVLRVEEESFVISWSRKSFEDELKNDKALYLVAKQDEKVIGYIGTWLIFDEAHITNIAVSYEFRNQKIGDKLVSELINICKDKKIKSMTLEVRNSNIIAQKLYKNHGFKLAGIRKEYYSDNKEDALIMWKEV